MLTGIYDQHSHTIYSPDALREATVQKVCESANQKGMGGFAVTDHYEASAPMEQVEEISASFQAVQAYKPQIEGKLLLTAGVEVGEASQNWEAAEKLIHSHSFDVILASLHNNAGIEDFYFLDYDKEDIPALLENYFTELYSIVKWNQFDVLTHLTYPLRYIQGTHGRQVDLSRYMDIIDEIFKTLIQNGKALEVNTSGLRQSLRDTMPHLPLLLRYKDFGGELITLGSDSHSPKNIGDGIKETLQQLKTAGFTAYVYYQERKPLWVSIP